MKRFVPRFTLGSLLLIVVIVGMGVAWWLDHARLKRELLNTQTRLEARELLAKERVMSAHDQAGYGGGLVPPADRNIYATPAEFITALRSMRDYYEWQNRMVEFVNTEVADEALPSLIELLEDPDPKVRERTLLTVSYLERHAEALVPVIIPLLDDKDQNVRWHAAHALGSFGSKARDAIPSLARIVESEVSPISAFAAGFAFKISPSVDMEPRLQEFLRSDDPDTRWRAVEALGRISPHKTIAKATEEALLEAFRRSENESTKRSIAGLLDHIAKGPSFESIQRTDGTYDEEERRESLTEAPQWDGKVDKAPPGVQVD